MQINRVGTKFELHYFHLLTIQVASRSDCTENGVRSCILHPSTPTKKNNRILTTMMNEIKINIMEKGGKKKQVKKVSTLLIRIQKIPGFNYPREGTF